MIAHADVQKPPTLHVRGNARIMPCYSTIRTLAPDAHYRYHRVVVRPGASGGFVSGLSLKP